MVGVIFLIPYLITTNLVGGESLFSKQVPRMIKEVIVCVILCQKYHLHFIWREAYILSVVSSRRFSNTLLEHTRSFVHFDIPTDTIFFYKTENLTVRQINPNIAFFSGQASVRCRAWCSCTSKAVQESHHGHNRSIFPVLIRHNLHSMQPCSLGLCVSFHMPN